MDQFSLRHNARFLIAFALTLFVAWLADFNLKHTSAVLGIFCFEMLALKLVIRDKQRQTMLREEPTPTFTRSGKYGPSHLRAMK